MQTIIAPTDLSDISLNAVYYAADMALSLNAKLLIMYATESPFTLREINPEPTDDELAIENKLKALKLNLIERTDSKVLVRTTHVIGLIENEIIKLCSYTNPLAIIMATKGSSMKEQLFMESITVYLSKNIQYPVIVVPQGVQYKPIKKILLATDLENLYNAPVNAITNVVKAFNAHLDIVHVYNNENKFEIMTSRMTELVKYLEDVNPQFYFVYNTNVYNGIIEFATQNNSDVILTLPRKHAFFHKSQSKQLVFNAPLTVITIQ